MSRGDRDPIYVCRAFGRRTGPSRTRMSQRFPGPLPLSLSVSLSLCSSRVFLYYAAAFLGHNYGGCVSEYEESHMRACGGSNILRKRNRRRFMFALARMRICMKTADTVALALKRLPMKRRKKWCTTLNEDA